MAPSQGHLLVPKILKIAKFAISKTASLVRSKLPQNQHASASLQPVRIYAQNQPLHPLAYLKQSRAQNQNRGFSTNTTTPTGNKAHSNVKNDRSTFTVSRTSRALAQRGTVPFASTLRPNLTGGALPRSAGGYGLGGARYFSHTPGCQAQVVHTVSAGIRAFFVNGGKARFDGVDCTGNKTYRAISQTEDELCSAWENPMRRGTILEFSLTPTITAFPYTKESELDLNTPTLLTTLASDFAHAKEDLSIILVDIMRLSAFGNLPVSYHSTSSSIQVRFSGCDAELVARLCDEVDVKRGVIREDDAWDESREVEMALLFPFAPGTDAADTATGSEEGAAYFEQPPLVEQEVQREQLDWRAMMSPPRTALLPYHNSEDMRFEDIATLRSPLHKSTSPSGYDSLRASDTAAEDPYYHGSWRAKFQSKSPTNRTASGDYEGLEGIYKFLQVCDEAKR